MFTHLQSTLTLLGQEDPKKTYEKALNTLDVINKLVQQTGLEENLSNEFVLKLAENINALYDTVVSYIPPSEVPSDWEDPEVEYLHKIYLPK
jgi:hypothetical protein